MKIMKYLATPFILLLVACSNQSAPIEVKQEIEFFAPIRATEENEVEIALQITSPKGDLEADPDFAGRMKLYEENGDLRAEAVMKENPFMKKGEIYQIMTWRGFLEPGEYQLDWSSTKYGGTQITFEVYEHESGQFYIGDQTIVINSPN